MIASESETGGSGRGKALAWRSRSCKDTAPGVGRDAGSESGRDIGRNIASWWTSAVEQTSTFLMDEVPATFAGLSVGAKELKPALQRGASFSSFSLGWKLNGEGSKGAVEVPKCPEDVPPEGSKLELPKVSPRLRLERSLERSHSRKQVEKAQSPSLSSAKLLDRSPHSSKNLLEKVQEPSVSSPKQLERSSHTTKNVENMQQPSLSLPKQLERSPHRTKKHVEETQEPSASLPKQLERSPQRTLEHVEKIHEPSSKPFKWIPLTATKHEAKLSAMETPSEVSPGKASMYSGKSPLRSGESPLSALEIPTYTDSSPRKGTKSLPRKASKHVENSSLETPKPSPSKSTKHMEKSPHSTPKTPVIPSESSPIITTDPRSSSRLRESRRRTKRMPVDIATTELEASPIMKMNFLTPIALVSTVILAVPVSVKAANPADVQKLKEGSSSCVGCNLAGANLKGAHLIGVDLRKANLQGANLEGANLEGADLTGANLKSAKMTEAFINSASLNNANLTNADLRRANLDSTELKGAILAGAKLNGADIANAQIKDNQGQR